MIKLKTSFLYFTILLLAGCLPKYPVKWSGKGIFINQGDNDLIVKNSNKNLKIVYTGCGGVALDDGSEVVVTDPFFSNQPFLNIGLGKIQTNSNSVYKGLSYLSRSGTQSKKVKHIFIAHSHYDHLMDVPFLLQNNFFNDSLKVYGSTTTKNIINNYIKPERFINLEKVSYYPGNEFFQTGDWIYLSKNIRVLPVKAQHAPHFLGIELMHGEVGDGGINNFNSPTDKTKAQDWKSGSVFSFLIDYINDNQIELRIFIQSSSCTPLGGIPPSIELDQRKVDVAIIGVASAQNVDDYPETLLESIQPSKIILIHWEDFFRKYGLPAKTVRFTNFNIFFKRMGRAFEVTDTGKLKGKVIMPEPGRLINIKY